jgi:hypothetical protein
MQIESTREEPRYRSGTLKGLTLADIQRALPEIAQDNRPSADRKVTLTWRFLADGIPCAVWDYRRSYEIRRELSTFGPDRIFAELFGPAYTSLNTK